MGELVDGWIHGWMDGQTDGPTNRLVDGWKTIKGFGAGVIWFDLCL